MEVSVSISPEKVSLGQPVTITFTSTGCSDSMLTIDNFPAPIVLGSGDVSGTMKVLPLTDGQFNVQITGSGRFGAANDYMPQTTSIASCQVS
jgi:hypothetical protein